MGGELNLEQDHYTVKELAAKWGLSYNTIRRLFNVEPGVVRVGAETVGHRRTYFLMRIPKEVAERVYRRMGGGQIPAPKAAKAPKAPAATKTRTPGRR